jgi:hypothetical protein
VLRAAGGALGWLLALLAIVGGVGWLYLIRDVHLLAVGPSVSGALPLEELAKRGAQPLLRMVVAWLPAGLAAGLAVALATRLRAVAIAGAIGVLAFLVLASSTIGSLAVAHNETFGENVSAGLGRSGLWAAAAIVVIGAILGAVAARRGLRGRSGASSAARAPGFWAA